MAITDDFSERYRASGITQAGLSYIQKVRTSPPARRVGGSRFLSVACRFPSQKMGCTIQAESRTGEYPYLLTLELDEDVLEFYDQPQPVQIIRDRAGRKHISSYTPDFLVLRSGYPEVVEVKPRATLEKSRFKHPDDWVWRDEQWINVPVYSYFSQQLGIAYRIHIAEDIGQIEAANLNLLVAAHRLDLRSNEEALLNRLARLLEKNAITTTRVAVDELMLEDATPILRWIAERKIFAATTVQFLSDPLNARLFSSENLARSFADAKSLECSVAQNSSRSLTTDASMERVVAPNIEALTDRQIAKAFERYGDLMPVLQGDHPPTRNQSRLLQRMKTSQAAGEGILAGLAPLHHKQGNRIPRISEAQEALMKQAQERYYATAARRSKYWVYMSIQWGELPKVSYKTFRLFLKRTPKHELAKKRMGHRSWAAIRPPSHPDTRAASPTTAWELVHIDHTPIDEKVWAELGAAYVLGRPWLTTMIDGWSDAVLAFWLSFSPPSWKSLSMLLRDCVRRHGHLPLAWISDQGPEFGGEYWETFSANYACTKLDRAKADPRCGSQVERSFNAVHRDLIHQLDGNMQNDREWRRSVHSHKSEANARFALAHIYQAIENYLFQHYNMKPHGTAAFTPAQKLQTSEADFLGLLRPVKYDRFFLIDTARHESSRRYTVDSRRGIRVGQRIYWHEDLALPKNDGTKVHVRPDPFNSSILYANVGNRWIDCVSAKHTLLKSFDEFGRWAQSAIDYYGGPFARALRQAADEHFVEEQSKIWTSPEGQLTGVRNEPAASASLTADLSDSRTGAARESNSIDTDQSAFEKLRKLNVRPFGNVDS